MKLCSRLFAADGTCAIDINLGVGARKDLASWFQMYNAAKALVDRCVQPSQPPRKPGLGGAIRKLGTPHYYHSISGCLLLFSGLALTVSHHRFIRTDGGLCKALRTPGLVLQAPFRRCRKPLQKDVGYHDCEYVSTYLGKTQESVWRQCSGATLLSRSYVTPVPFYEKRYGVIILIGILCFVALNACMVMEDLSSGDFERASPVEMWEAAEAVYWMCVVPHERDGLASNLGMKIINLPFVEP